MPSLTQTITMNSSPKILFSAIEGVCAGLIILNLLSGCTNTSLDTPAGCKEWVEMNVPAEFSCWPRAQFCKAHLEQHGYACMIHKLNTWPIGHAELDCVERKESR